MNRAEHDHSLLAENGKWKKTDSMWDTKPENTCDVPRRYAAGTVKPPSEAGRTWGRVNDINSSTKNAPRDGWYVYVRVDVTSMWNERLNEHQTTPG